jgi:hypothetical protein
VVEHKPIREILVSGVLSLLLGFLLTLGALLASSADTGTPYPASAPINWGSAELYLDILLYTLIVFMVLTLLWRALDFLSNKNLLAQARQLLQRRNDVPGTISFVEGMATQNSIDPSLPSAVEQKTNYVTATAFVSPAVLVSPWGTGSFSLESQVAQPALPGTAFNPVRQLKRRWLWLVALGFLLCWVPFWLGLWPGTILSSDTLTMHSASGLTTGLFEDLAQHQKENLLLDSLAMLLQDMGGQPAAGVALYSGLLLLGLSLVFSLLIRTLAQEYAGRFLLVFAFAFLALNPFWLFWLFSGGLDVLFAAVVLLLGLLVYRLLRPGGFGGRRDRLRHVGFAGCLAIALLVSIALLLHAEAFLALVLFTLIALILTRRYLRPRLLAALSSGLALFIGFLLLVTALASGAAAAQVPDVLDISRQQVTRAQTFMKDDAALRASYAAWYPGALPTDAALPLATTRVGARTTEEGAGTTDVAPDTTEEDAGALNTLPDTAKDKERADEIGTFTDTIREDMAVQTVGATAQITPGDGPGTTDPLPKPQGTPVNEWPVSSDKQTANTTGASCFLPDLGWWLIQLGQGTIGSDLLAVRLLGSPALYLWLSLVALARCLIVRNWRGTLVVLLFLLVGLAALLTFDTTLRSWLPLLLAAPLLCHICACPRDPQTHGLSDDASDKEVPPYSSPYSSWQQG